MEYNLTQHVKERYAERIMGRTDKSEINKFIAEHEDKIYDDIEKMIKYGEVIYEGQQVRSKDTRPCKYILRNDWLVVVNAQDKTVVTLYKINLGAGDEINQLYINTMVDKIKSATERAAEKVQVLNEITKGYQEGIEANQNLIDDYKKKIKSLEDQNESLRKLLEEEKANVLIAQEEIRDVLSVMCTGTKF